MTLRIYPDPIQDDTKSDAEKTLYRLFKEQLIDTDFVIIHSVAWIMRNPKDRASDGEADFIIAHPDYGVMILEVKGGIINLDGLSQHWTSTGRNGVVYPIKDPFSQTRRNKYTLSTKLNEDQRTNRYSWRFSQAVAFPDVHFGTQSLRPDAPAAMVIDADDLTTLETQLITIFRITYDPSTAVRLPSQAMDALIDLLAPSRQFTHSLSRRLIDDIHEIGKLSEKQFHLLNILAYQRQASITGGAGTGKTVLSIEKACRLVAEGYEVLWICFSDNVATWADNVFRHDERIIRRKKDNEDRMPIAAITFHTLCSKIIGDWSVGMRVNLSSHKRDNIFFAKTLSDEALNVVSSGKMSRRFNAIIVDEGQDIELDWWLVIIELLEDDQNSILYVFFDDNQNIYRKIKQQIPIKTEPYVLTENWRNNPGIHRLAQKYSQSTHTSTSIRSESSEPQFVNVSQQGKLNSLIVTLDELIRVHSVHPYDIIVLTPLSEEKNWIKANTHLKNRTLLVWGVNHPMSRIVRVSTIHAYKGLESPFVLLVDADLVQTDELLYVAISRAQSHLTILGQLPEPRAI